MTGMPAFGPTHNEKELWAIVAFTRRLPEMQAEDYRVVTKTGVCVVALLAKASSLGGVATPSIHPVLVTTRLMRAHEISSESGLCAAGSQLIVGEYPRTCNF